MKIGEKTVVIRKIIGNGIVQVMSANVLNNMVNMISNMIITRILTRSEYGIWSYTLNIYSYLSLISGLGLLSGAFQFGVENHDTEKESQYYKYCLYIGVIIDTFLAGIFLIGTYHISLSLPEAARYVRGIAPTIIIEYVYKMLLTILRCQNRLKGYAKSLNINTVLLAMGHCIGAVWGVEGVLIGRYLAMTISLVEIFLQTNSEIKKFNRVRLLKRKETGDLWHYSLMTGASSAINCVLYLLDVSMIAALVQDSEQLAFYKVATLIPTALTFIPVSVVTGILPTIVRNRQNTKWIRGYIKKVYAGLTGLNLVVCVFLILCAPFIISVLSGRQYLAAVPIFRVLVGGYFVSGTFRVLSLNILAAFRCVNYNLFLSVISGVSDLFLNYFLIKKFGMIGAAYATFAVDVITAILAVVYLFRIIYFEKRKV